MPTVKLSAYEYVLPCEHRGSGRIYEALGNQAHLDTGPGDPIKYLWRTRIVSREQQVWHRVQDALGGEGTLAADPRRRRVRPCQTPLPALRSARGKAPAPGDPH